MPADRQTLQSQKLYYLHIMKPLCLFALLLVLTGFACNKKSRDTPLTKAAIEKYLGKWATITAPGYGWASRKTYEYVFIGGAYPKQALTIMIKRRTANGTYIGTRQFWNSITYIGKIIRYDGPPDTSYVSWQRDSTELATTMVTDHGKLKEIHHFVPMSIKPHPPIDLRGTMVMIITDKKYIKEL